MAIVTLTQGEKNILQTTFDSNPNDYSSFLTYAKVCS
jgi:hypothetical protein